jgi:hypothetical protein
MNYYTLLFYTMVRLARRINPKVTIQGLSDGGYWAMNAIAGIYLIFILRFLTDHSQIKFLGVWSIFIVLNYVVFASGERWQEMAYAYDAKPRKVVNAHSAVLLILLLGSLFTLIFFWARYKVPR